MRALTLALIVALGATACGQSGGEGEAPEAAPPAEQSEPTPTPEPPEEIALTDTADFTIEGDTGVLATPGEQLVVEHLIRNGAATARSVGLRAATDADVDIEVSSRSIRVQRDEIVAVQSTLTVPDDAEVGEVIAYEVVAVNVDDIREKSVTAVQVLVTDAVGARPQVGDDAGRTATSERVFIFATADDTDPDGDLDQDSLRVIAGGWLADQITGNGNGTITYVPFANVEGVDVVMYEMCDDEQRCDTGLITVTIGAPE
ncbi:MAG: Ig-like domain-containing protein [Actinomycetota bacterium]